MAARRPAGKPAGRHCVIARFPKTGGTAVVRMLRSQPHVWQRKEDGQLRPADFSSRSFVIGQTRHPFDWYSSLWAYLSDHPTWVRASEDITRVLSTTVPRGGTTEDVRRFRSFVRLYTSPDVGAFSAHFWVNYVDMGSTVDRLPLYATPALFLSKLPFGALRPVSLAVQAHVQRRRRRQTSKALQQNRVSCWVRQEALLSLLAGCLSRCSRRLNASLIDWSLLQADRDAVVNPSSPRVANTVLYDEATRNVVARSDAHMFTFFGYNASDTAAGDRRLWMAKWNAKHDVLYSPPGGATSELPKGATNGLPRAVAPLALEPS